MTATSSSAGEPPSDPPMRDLAEGGSLRNLTQRDHLEAQRAAPGQELVEMGRVKASGLLVGRLLESRDAGAFAGGSTHLDGRRRPAARSSPATGEVARAGAERPRHCRHRWARVTCHPCQRSHVRVHSASGAGGRGGCSHGVGRPWQLLVLRRPHRESPGVGHVATPPRSRSCRCCLSGPLR